MKNGRASILFSNGDTLNPWLRAAGLALPIALFLAMVGRDFLEWQNGQRLRRELAATQSRNATAQVALQIERIFFERTNELARLARIFRSSPENDREAFFLSETNRLLARDPSYRSFHLVGADNTIRLSTEADPKHAFTEARTIERRNLLIQLREQYAPALSTPHTNAENDDEIDLFYPLFDTRDNQSLFLGALSSTLRLRKSLQTAFRSSVPPGSCVRVDIGGREICSSPPNDRGQNIQALSSAPAHVMDRSWRVTSFAQPSASTGERRFSTPFPLVLNVFLSLLVSLFLFLALDGLLKIQSRYAALRRSEHCFRQLADNLPEIFWLFDATSQRMIYMSPAYERIWGRPLETLNKNPLDWLSTVHPDDYKKAFECFLPSDSPHPFECQYRILRPTGDARWVLSRGFPVTDPLAATIRIAGITEDITERKRREDDLRANEKTLRQIIDLVPHLIFAKDKNGRILLANQAFASAYGLSVESVTNRLHREIHPSGGEVHQFLQDDRVVFDSGQPAFIAREKFTDCLNRVRIHQTTRIPFIIPRMEESAILGISIDITKQEESEKEQTQLEEQLRQSQKMEAIGHLAGGVAHDFNNLLTGIIGYSNLVLRTLDRDNVNYRSIKEIQKAGEQAAGLTQQLLAFSRKQILEPKILCLSDLIANMKDMLRRMIGEDIDIHTRLDASRGFIKADPAQITQIVMNLAINARDAMPHGGDLTVEIDNLILNSNYNCGHPEILPGSYMLLAVSDTGLGMDKDTQRRIFEPFFTTKEPGKGTGLGLSTVYGIVKQSGGYIYVYSEPGHGTTFKIYFPKVEQTPEITRKKPVSSESFHGRETILLVEDDEIVCQMSSIALQEYGYTVFKAVDASEAYAIYEQCGKPIHLLLTDVVLPKESGHILAEKLKELNPSLKVLFMSGYTHNAIVNHGILEEGIDFLHKPFTAETLARKVREVLSCPSVV